MSSKLKFLFVFVCVIWIFQAYPAFLHAQARKGDSEILVNGYLLAQTGEFGYRMITTTFNYGYYLSDRIQVGGGPSISYYGSEGDNSVMLNLNAFGRKYFLKRGRKYAFYTGAELFWYNAFSSGSTGYLRPFGGVKYYLGRGSKAAFDANIGVGTDFKGAMFYGIFGVTIML
jgi:hypothetical protein